jgi:hypothetical protein
VMMAMSFWKSKMLLFGIECHQNLEVFDVATKLELNSIRRAIDGNVRSKILEKNRKNLYRWWLHRSGLPLRYFAAKFDRLSIHWQDKYRD